MRIPAFSLEVSRCWQAFSFPLIFVADSSYRHAGVTYLAITILPTSVPMHLNLFAGHLRLHCIVADLDDSARGVSWYTTQVSRNRASCSASHRVANW